MRDPKRIDPFLKRLSAVWKANPDLRLGQLVVNALGPDPFYVEDDDLLRRLEEYTKSPG